MPPADNAVGCDGPAQAAQLAALVQTAFPSLALGRHRVEQAGGDHVLLIVEDRVVFRFPRCGMHGLQLEIALLQRLQPLSPVATPLYQYVDPAGRFAGYRFIAGSALTPIRFAALSLAGQCDVLQTAASFLTVLHGLAADAIAPRDDWAWTWTSAEFADHASTQYIREIGALGPQPARMIKAFYDLYRAIAAPAPVVVHGDLVAEHFLLDEQTGQLSGIIDFGDVALGDPAQDFLGFWAYGADTVARVIAAYPPAQADPGLLARSRNHFIRYRLDHLLDAMRSHGLQPAIAAAQIAALLAR